jgi:uncharacterized protein YecA (UPF0149 family)
VKPWALPNLELALDSAAHAGTARPEEVQQWPRSSTTTPAFEITSKRRKGYPSESQVKKGLRVVHGEKELLERLGRNDPCPCGSGQRFQTLLLEVRPIRR